MTPLESAALDALVAWRKAENHQLKLPMESNLNWANAYGEARARWDDLVVLADQLIAEWEATS